MATGNSIVGDAYSKTGRLSSGETATNQELADGINELNRMWGRWSAELGNVNAETLDSLTWSSGQDTRTIGIGGNFNVTRPLTIVGAEYRDSSSFDYKMTLLTHREYQEITPKLIQTTFPVYLAYNPTFTSSLGTLLIWPVPASDLTIRLNSMKPIDDFTGSGTVILPPGYEDALVLNLAVRLGEIQGRPVSQITYNMAIRSKAAIVQMNIHPQTLKPDPLAPGGSLKSNPRAYWNI